MRCTLLTKAHDRGQQTWNPRDLRPPPIQTFLLPPGIVGKRAEGGLWTWQDRRRGEKEQRNYSRAMGRSHCRVAGTQGLLAAPSQGFHSLDISTFSTRGSQLGAQEGRLFLPALELGGLPLFLLEPG